MRTILKKAGAYLLRAGLSQSEYKQITEEVRKSNRQNLMIMSVIAALFLMIVFFVSFKVEAFQNFRWLYLITTVIMLCIFGIARFSAAGRPLVLIFGIYIFIGCLFAFGIAIGTFPSKGYPAATFIALILTVPLLFADRPIRSAINTYIYVIIFSIIVVSVKEEQIIVTDVANGFIFGTISVIIGTYMMSVKCRRHLYEQRAILISETDILTGLRNRNAYEKNISLYPYLCEKNLACVFMDVNGLHELNNREGHQRGDKMLQFLGRQMQEQFGIENTFRIGGDEFVAFEADISPDKLTEKVNQIITEAEKEDYDISIGCCIEELQDIDMTQMVNTAEQRMYDNKKAFYRKKGLDISIRK